MNPGTDQHIESAAIVVPVYNEEDAIEILHASICRVIDSLPCRCLIYYINDGSTDRTGEILERMAESDARVTAVELSRNFGHQAALTAGLDLAEGDVVITMDGDGQHPPELIPEMLRLAQSGYDIVLTQRMDKDQPSRFKRWTSSAFYWFLNRISNTKIPPGSADFRLMSRQAADALRGMREYHRFLRGMVAWAGYRTVILPYAPPERLAGVSKYSLRKMIRLAMDAAFSFSLAPLQLGISLGVFFLVLACLEMVYVLSFWVRGRQDLLVPGWSSQMFIILIVGGALMIVLGFIGVYVGYIFQEVKRRPIYLIRTREGKHGDSPVSEGEAEAGDA
jgi:glycosyltransferase involved in cell wall biosynthesis